MDSASSYVRKEAAIPMRILDILSYKGKRSICRVSFSNKIQGSAGLIVTKYNNRQYYMIITCNHVLPFNASCDFSKVQIHFQGLKEAELHDKFLRKKWIQSSWTSSFYDATVIELTKETVEYFLDFGADFLEASSKEVKTDEKIGLVQYPKGEFSFSNGEVYDIIGKNLYYWAEGDEGSSGSPVLSYEGSAIAVHNCKIKSDFEDRSRKEARRGTLLKDILGKYFEDKYQSYR